MDLPAPQPEIEHHLVWPTLTLLTPNQKFTQTQSTSLPNSSPLAQPQ